MINRMRFFPLSLAIMLFASIPLPASATTVQYYTFNGTFSTTLPGGTGTSLYGSIAIEGPTITLSEPTYVLQAYAEGSPFLTSGLEVPYIYQSQTYDFYGETPSLQTVPFAGLTFATSLSNTPLSYANLLMMNGYIGADGYFIPTSKLGTETTNFTVTQTPTYMLPLANGTYCNALTPFSPCSPVPAPPGWLMMLTGLGLLVPLYRRYKRGTRAA